MYYNDLILANGAIRLSFFPFCFEGQRGKGYLIHLIYTLSTHSPNSMLLSDLWKHKRAQPEPCTDWLLRIPLFCNFSLGELSLYFILLKSIIIIISLIVLVWVQWIYKVNYSFLFVGNVGMGRSPWKSSYSTLSHMDSWITFDLSIT